MTAFHRTPKKRVSPKTRGFTLTEIMAVVVIMSILAVIGLTAVRGQMGKAALVELRATMKAIAAAQERYRAENGQYQNTSGGNLADLYPMATPDGREYAFWGWGGGSPSPTVANWERLRPDINNPVTFGYAVVSGLPTAVTTVYPTLALSAAPTWTATRSPWYVIQARCDADGDGTMGTAVLTSFSPDMTLENEDE